MSAQGDDEVGSRDEMVLRKYPRTPHLPWSPGASSDDTRIVDTSCFAGRRVIVSEKMDGECTTLFYGKAYARSVGTARHPSRSRVRALAASIHNVGDLAIVGENVLAEHSIHYAALPAYFLVFAAVAGSTFKSWDSTLALAKKYDLSVVPVLYDGLWDEKRVRACWTGTSRCGGAQKGYVVRVADSFDFADFSWCVAKYVRAGHVQTDEHWMQRPVVPNGLVVGKVRP